MKYYGIYLMCKSRQSTNRRVRQKKTYKELKEAARNKAIEWQMDFKNHDYSYGEIAYFQNYFEKLGKRYGLLKEFRENAII